MFLWTDDKLDLYIRAAKLTSYHEKLGEIIKNNIGLDREIWDIGSGISFLSLYLSEYSNKIICVDKSGLALKKLDKIIHDRNIDNIETLEEDYKFFLEEKKKGDVILVSHFLDIEENLDLLLSKGKTIVIVKNSDKRKEKNLFSGKKQSMEDVEKILDGKYKELSYKKILYKGDFGQPLENIEEAQEYYKSYSEKEITREAILEKIEVGYDKQYPYYYPKEKLVGVIIIENGDVNEE